MENFPMVTQGRLTPGVAEKVFDLLPINDLLKFRQVSKDWKYFVDSKSKLWRGSFGLKCYFNAAQAGRLDVCKLLLRYRKDKNPANGSGLFFETKAYQQKIFPTEKKINFLLNNFTHANKT